MNDKLPKLPGQQPPQIDAAKTGWTLSWRIKGMALGLAISLIYFHFFKGSVCFLLFQKTLENLFDTS